MTGGFSGPYLAIFTTLAPAGALSFACLAVFLFARLRMEEGKRMRVMHALAFPIAVVWAGFIASAVHLGTPANALHVASGVGRSPLSNEVAAVVAFLFLAGVCWLYSYRVRPSKACGNALLFAALCAAVALLGFTSVAYSVPTVPSWDTWLTPANLLMSALLAGPAFAALVLQGSRCEARRWPYVLLALSCAALAAGTVLLCLHAQFLAHVANNVDVAAHLVPGYRLCIAGHTVLGALGLALQVIGLRVRISHVRGVVFGAIGWFMVAGAVLMARLPFYAAYLSVGF